MNKQNQNSKLQIRNSTAEFLIFTNQTTGEAIEVRIENNTVWLTQKLIAALFDVDRSVITKHLNNIYQENELSKEATCAFFAQVQIEGNRQITRNIEFYNLDAIITIGYRVNSKRATVFRQWATGVLRDFAIRGYVIDRKRMENGMFFAEEYAKRRIPLTMEDWAKHLNLILQANGKDLLQNTGKITAAIAKQHAENEFEKYRPIQDRLFESDFDKMLKIS